MIGIELDTQDIFPGVVGPIGVECRDIDVIGGVRSHAGNLDGIHAVAVAQHLERDRILLRVVDVYDRMQPVRVHFPGKGVHDKAGAVGCGRGLNLVEVPIRRVGNAIAPNVIKALIRLVRAKGRQQGQRVLNRVIEMADGVHQRALPADQANE